MKKKQGGNTVNLSENFAVTLGREYGSGGKAIAEAVGSKLGIRVYDKSMIRMIAEQENRQPTLLDIMNERAYNQLFDPFINYDIDTNIPANSSKLFDFESDIIRSVADEGPAIFIGRCANEILWDYPNVIRVFVFAPKTDRVKRIMEKEGIADAFEAEKVINRMDRARKTYYQLYSDRKWGTSDGMDLMINSSSLGIEGSAELIVDMLVRRGYVTRL